MPSSIEGTWIARFMGTAEAGAAGASAGRRESSFTPLETVRPAVGSSSGRESAIAIFSSTDLRLGSRGGLLLEAPPRTPGGSEARLATFLERSARAELGEGGEPAMKLAALIERHLDRHRALRVLRTRTREGVERGGR